MSDLIAMVKAIQAELAEMQTVLGGDVSAPKSRQPKRKKPQTRPRQCTDVTHGECRIVPVLGGAFELIKCPWCEFPLSPSNAYKWCGNCYTLYEIVESGGYKVAHFGKGIEKPFGVALAIALAKSGGMRFGEVSDRGHET